MSFNPDQPRDAQGRWSPVGEYISEEGFAINERLRSGDSGGENISKLDSIISEHGTSYGGELYRGANADFTNYVANQAGLRELKDGTDYSDSLRGLQISDAGYTSTTMSRSIAEDFSQRRGGLGTVLVIKSNGKSLNISDIMGKKTNWQEERIFPRDSTFTITGGHTDYDAQGNTVLILDAEI